MDETAKRKMVLRIAYHYLGTWYQWGGDDPRGFDCSGLAIECLKSVGVLPYFGDWTAHQLFTLFPIRPANPKPGDLVFWASSSGNRIRHVEIAVSDELSIGASGGGSGVRTVDDAVRENAYIKIRPIETRRGFRCYANPYL